MSRLLISILLFVFADLNMVAQGLPQKAVNTSSLVHVLSDSFYMPQLKTSRKIWIYIPPSYATTKKRYPVLYMQDGQNLFDDATSFAGEWGVDESLDQLAASGGPEVIVVGLENGGERRLNEYSPWTNAKYGGGLGEAYAAFLAETLKPFVDRHYRTKRKAKHTAVAGSSMGGLISLYTGLRYPEKFGKMGIFSPSIWFAESDLKLFINKNHRKIRNSRIYLVAGKNESADMQSDIEEIRGLLLKKGLKLKNIKTKIDADGAHNESYWRREFLAVAAWLLD